MELTLFDIGGVVLSLVGTFVCTAMILHIVGDIPAPVTVILFIIIFIISLYSFYCGDFSSNSYEYSDGIDREFHVGPFSY